MKNKSIIIGTLLLFVMTALAGYLQAQSPELQLPIGAKQFKLNRLASNQSTDQAVFLIDNPSIVSVEIISNIQNIQTSVVTPTGRIVTPANGSVLADLSIEREEAAKQVGYLGRIEYEGFPDYTRQLTAISQYMGIDDGRRDLTTGSVAGFNNRNLPLLDGLGVTFNTVTGDADLNSNGRMDRSPDEYAALRTESTYLRLAPDNTATSIVNSLYQILRKTRGVSVSYRDQCLPPFGRPCRKIATVRSIDNATLLGNDTLVTIPSGLGEGSIRSRVSNSQTFTRANGRNHSSIADRGIAQTIIPWLIDVDRRKGGLR